MVLTTALSGSQYIPPALPEVTEFEIRAWDFLLSKPLYEELEQFSNKHQKRRFAFSHDGI
jgi:hypothetical protein